MSKPKEPFIIAEIGSNWKSYEDCMNSISLAKRCGADAVKFQLYTHDALYGINDPQSTLKGVMPKDWIPKLAEKAKACDIEFMCSAFSPELYDVVNPYVVTHKVASSELTHKRILEKLSSYGKPVILSTACASYKEIDKALELLHPCDVVLMYCVGAYPANLVDLRLIKDLQERYPDNTIGFSDHTKDVMSIPYEAVKKYGAMVIEKHVTFIDDDTPDSPHSLNRMDFMTMCDAIKGEWKLVFGPTREERDMLIKHRRRLIATANIPQGGTLQEGINFGIYRSQIEDTRAIHGFDIDSVNGKQTKVDIKEGFGIAPEDLA